MTRQRVSKRKHWMIEQRAGLPVRSAWARGGRNPRYWDVFFGAENDTEGPTGRYYPKTQHLEMSDIGWVKMENTRSNHVTP